MMASASVVNVTNNKYIILSLEICAIDDNKYNYNKTRLQIISKFEILCGK